MGAPAPIDKTRPPGEPYRPSWTFESVLSNNARIARIPSPPTETGVHGLDRPPRRAL